MKRNHVVGAGSWNYPSARGTDWGTLKKAQGKKQRNRSDDTVASAIAS